MRDFGDVTTTQVNEKVIQHSHPSFSEGDYAPLQAEMEVEEATIEQSGPSCGDQKQSAVPQARQSKGLNEMADDGITPPAVTNPSKFIPGSNPTTPGPQTTRRRPGPPGSIPNFPGSMALRDPPPFFNSPVTSPPSQSPLSSPPQRASGSLRLPTQPLVMPDAVAGSPMSPWHHLAATSGAPTPSIDGPGPGRNSPHLGYPFERLNIGGSWSGANLWGDQPPVPNDGRRSSIDMSVDPPSSPSQPSRDNKNLSMNAEMLAKYRAMAGKASANGKGKEPETATSMAGGSTSASQRPPLPAALAKRRASLPKDILGGMLSPTALSTSKAPSPLASSTTSPSPNPGLKPLPVSSLQSLVGKPSTLILDLRPPSAYQVSHLPSSHSIPVPSTLLRRPAFNLNKLIQMLSPKGAEAVSQWRSKSDIILVDSESSLPTSNTLLEGVSSKFEREGYQGNMWFVKGGHAAVVASKIKLEAEGDQPADQSDSSGEGRGGLQVGRLGKLAFMSESTGSNLQLDKSLPLKTSTSLYSTDPFAASASSLSGTQSISNSNSTERGELSSQTTRQKDGQSQTNSSGSSSSQTAKIQPANPFFDNIRQNLELSHGGGHERISLELPEEVAKRKEDLPPWLAQLAALPDQESAERLAEEFYKVERGEQKRLQAVMDWHSNSSGGIVFGAPEAQKEVDQKAKALYNSWADGEDVGEKYFPYSITAGVERGTKNRYKNIWPYDFSRVRLDTPEEDQGDYINASFVQPKGTTRRYIATQGPLDSTYRDFWTLVWEQHVSVIVMLTKQYEAGTIKCGNYWEAGQYGPIRVHLESQTGGEDTRPTDISGFDFGMSSEKKAEDVDNITRTFSLTRQDKPNEPPRKVIQIQCTAWPDFDVPDTPETLIRLIEDVDTATNETQGATDQGSRADQPPVLVHCSAGVGRTGTFIIVDAIVDALRAERGAQLAESSQRGESNDPAHEQQLLHGASLPPLSPSGRSMQVSRGASESRSSGADSPTGSGGDSAPDSALGSGSGLRGGSASGDSSKSVSFLIPPSNTGLANPGLIDPSLNFGSTDNLPSAFSGSPTSVSQKVPHSPIRKSSNRSNEIARAVPQLESQAEEMDVDEEEPTEDEKRKSIFDGLFMKHRREDSVSSLGSEQDAARPSLSASSGWASADRSSLGRVSQKSGVDMPVPVTKSTERHHLSTSVTDTDGLSPVAVVLEGMRTQRMSLVQSLRQYLFVHRVIIQSYLNMVDEDRKHGRDITQEARPPLRSQTSQVSQNTASTDDDSHSKRRASPTELVPEKTKGKESPGSNLAKRPSFKKMRPTESNDNMGDGGGKPTMPTVPRRLSKMNLE